MQLFDDAIFGVQGEALAAHAHAERGGIQIQTEGAGEEMEGGGDGGAWKKHVWTAEEYAAGGQAYWAVVTRDASPEAGASSECIPAFRAARTYALSQASAWSHGVLWFKVRG